MNLIEGLWGYLKRSALNNYFFGDTDSLEAAIHDAFAHLQQHPETALSLAYRIDTELRKTARPLRFRCPFAVTSWWSDTIGPVVEREMRLRVASGFVRQPPCYRCQRRAA